MADATAVGPVPEMDAHLPRWRRPSLIEARKADPMRGGGAAAAAHLAFEQPVIEAMGGLERRRIRYRMVSLLDAPDEVRGVEIGSLDEGDEVVLIEKRGTYWRVLCPDGREGWLHKMTLGDVVIATSGAADSWTSADDGPAVGELRGRPARLQRVAEPVRRFPEPARQRLSAAPGATSACRRAASAAPRCAGARCSARTTAG